MRFEAYEPDSKGWVVMTGTERYPRFWVGGSDFTAQPDTDEAPLNERVRVYSTSDDAWGAALWQFGPRWSRDVRLRILRAELAEEIVRVARIMALPDPNAGRRRKVTP